MSPPAKVDARSAYWAYDRIRLRTILKQYLSITKPTIGLLVVVTAMPTLLMASGSTLDLRVALAAIFGTFLASASAATFNHVIDRQIDALMVRTKARAIPAGHISRTEATWFGVCLGAIAFFLLYRYTFPLAAWIAVAANAFYVLVYTMGLKRRTTQNIVIGGAAGAVGPLIGWAAVTGVVGWPAWALFLVIFLWTPPHFWALAIKYKDDYARAGIPMLPAVKGDAVTRRMILAYALTLVPATLSISLFGAAGWIYGSVAGAASVYFAYLAARLVLSGNNKLAMPIFHYSCLYLFVIFGALALDQLIYLA